MASPTGDLLHNTPGQPDRSFTKRPTCTAGSGGSSGYSTATEEPAQPVSEYERRYGGVVLVGVYLDGDVEAVKASSPELFGEPEEVVHHVEVGRRRLAGMAVGEVPSLKTSTLVGLEPSDAEERLELRSGGLADHSASRSKTA